MPDISFGLFDFTAWFFVVFFIAMVVMLVMIGAFVWAIFRTAGSRDDPAVAELKDRLARGEIDTAEYQVRRRALRDKDG